MWGEVEHSEVAQGRGILERPLREVSFQVALKSGESTDEGTAAQGQETMAGVLGWFGLRSTGD